MSVTLDAYAPVEDLRTDLRIDSTDQDAELTRALNLAARAIEKACGQGDPRRFKPADAPTVVIVHPRSSTRVRCPDLHNITLVEHDPTDSGAWSTVSASYWRGLPGPDRAGWPTTVLEARQGHQWTGPVRITATAGWPSIPADVAGANLLLAGRLWKRPASPEGLVISGDAGAVHIARTDPDVAALLAPFRQMGAVA